MATKKTTTKKSRANTARKTITIKQVKTVSKKAQKVGYRSTASPLAAPSKWLLLGLGIGWGFLAYGFASWAIDSGSLWHYLFVFISIYFFVSYLQRFITIQFKK